MANKNPNIKPNSAEAILLAEKKLEIMRLRLNGYRVRDIAHRMSMPESTVSIYIKQALKASQSELDELGSTFILMESERLDMMLESIEPKLAVGNLMAIDKALRIQERRAKLFGLDKPIKIAPTTPDGENEYDSTDFKAKLAEMLHKKVNDESSGD